MSAAKVLLARRTTPIAPLGRLHDFVTLAHCRNNMKDRANYQIGAGVYGRVDEWTSLMRAAIAGDGAAYRRLLDAVAPVLRATARRSLASAGQPVDQSEDIVQDILLAVHLKRHTWNAEAPFAPWLFAIARNKLIDALRRRGRRVFVNIDDVLEVIAAPPMEESLVAEGAMRSREVASHLDGLPPRQRDVLRYIAVDGASIRETANRLLISEGAVRVALHRGLANLAARLREE